MAAATITHAPSFAMWQRSRGIPPWDVIHRQTPMDLAMAAICRLGEQFIEAIGRTVDLTMAFLSNAWDALCERFAAAAPLLALLPAPPPALPVLPPLRFAEPLRTPHRWRF